MSTRREALGFIALAPVAAILARAFDGQVRRLSMEDTFPSDLSKRLAQKWHVRLDGNAVCSQCYAADIKQGFVAMYKRDESGHFYLEPRVDFIRYVRSGDGTLVREPREQHPVREIRYGHVELLPPGADCDCGKPKFTRAGENAHW